MNRRPLLVIVLAAGKGTRMRSAIAQGAAQDCRAVHAEPCACVSSSAIKSERIAVVVGPGMEDVRGRDPEGGARR